MICARWCLAQRRQQRITRYLIVADRRAGRITSAPTALAQRPFGQCFVLHCHTMAEGLDWLPEDGVVLTRADLERIFIDLRELISGTDQLDPNRSFAVDIAVAITNAIERESGGQ